MNNNRNIFTKSGALLFALIGVIQLVRIVYEWEAVINGITIPIWVSVLALFIAFVMSYGLWKKSH